MTIQVCRTSLQQCDAECDTRPVLAGNPGRLLQVLEYQSLFSRSLPIGKHHGRCIDVSRSPDSKESRITLQSQHGVVQVELRENSPLPRVGDIVEADDGVARVLTPNRTSEGNTLWMGRILDPRRMRAVAIRSRVEALIREFFLSRDFIETRTPLLVPSPGMEPHIRPFGVEGTGALKESGAKRFLPTSPEFAMKRLLVGGLERIFQICPAFRDEPNSITHRPEFTMLEWYRAYAGYEDIMHDTEEMLAWIAVRLFGKPELKFQGRVISVAPPWPRLVVRDLFREHIGVDLVASATRDALAREAARLDLTVGDGEDWDDIYFKIWLNLIEPKLPEDRAFFVTRYPASQAALSVVDTDPDGSRWARRFEAYAGGIELGNAFEELTDPQEQRKRFVKDMELRTRVYGPEFAPSPLDEGFLGALTEGMPPSGGIAVGVDRLAMLFADEPEIDYTHWLPV